MTETESLLMELAEARRQATLDPLTGLGNVRALDAVLGTCFREGTPFTIVLFDVAHMKRANEAEGYGYPWVDALLTRIGGVLRQSRGDGFAFRKGGDEFLVVLPRAGVRAGRQVRDRVEKLTGVEVLEDGTPVFIAGGVARWDGTTTFGEVVDDAQQRMRRRKQAKRS